MRPTDEQAAAFESDGFYVFEGGVLGAELELLRREADLAVEYEDERIRTKAAGVENVTLAGERYFVAGRSRERTGLRSILFNEMMSATCARILGPDAFLFTELFVCKMARNTSSFGWHQDFGYLDYFGFGHYSPNLTIWIALDDMTADNGALRVLPFSRGGTRLPVKHRLDLDWKDQVADFGDLPGELLLMPAGSVVVMSGLLPHKSGRNLSDARRRAYLVQYSRQPVLQKGKPVQFAVPLLRGGAAQTPIYSSETVQGLG